MSGPAIVLAGGGSGGHITPGLALASVLAERGARLLWIGARGGLESEVVPAAGIPYEESGMKRVSTGVARTVRRLVSALGAVPAARRMLRSFGADAVVGLGGYASVPVLMAARLSGVPSYLVEANAIPGAVTRRFAASASAVFSNFACARDYLPKRVLFHHTGIPIRPELAEKLASRRPPPLGGPERLLVLGGSQGARALNKAVVGALPSLELEFPGLSVVHITGRLDYEALAAFYRSRPNAEVHPFLEDMTPAYLGSTVALTRAGAVSLAELSLAGIPSVVVPLPHSADDHQTANARFYAERGAAVLLPQSKLTPSSLIREMVELLHDREKRIAVSTAFRSLARPDAARAVADLLLDSIAERRAA